MQEQAVQAIQRCPRTPPDRHYCFSHPAAHLFCLLLLRHLLLQEKLKLRQAVWPCRRSGLASFIGCSCCALLIMAPRAPVPFLRGTGRHSRRLTEVGWLSERSVRLIYRDCKSVHTPGDRRYSTMPFYISHSAFLPRTHIRCKGPLWEERRNVGEYRYRGRCRSTA